MRKIFLKLSRILLPVAAAFSIGTAHAGWVEPAAQSTTYSFGISFSGGDGGIKKTGVSYTTGTEMLDVKYEFASPKTDGFWLVLSDGPDPKKGASEYAILYGDLGANRLSVYAYDTKLGEESYKGGNLLASYDGILSKKGFSLDVTDINNAFKTKDWDGVQIGEKAGIWFHASTDSEFSYGKKGELRDYEFCGQSWVDAGNISTKSDPNTPVSEPAEMLTFAAGSALLVFFIRKRKAEDAIA